MTLQLTRRYQRLEEKLNAILEKFDVGEPTDRQKTLEQRLGQIEARLDALEADSLVVVSQEKNGTIHTRSAPKKRLALS